MNRKITQGELRNECGEIMRALERQFVAAEVAVAFFAAGPVIDAERFRADVDRVLDQSAAPRA